MSRGALPVKKRFRRKKHLKFFFYLHLFCRYHLQALRHLYVLAAEPRIVIPRDIEKGRLVFAHLDVELADTRWYKGFTLRSRAPAILPELGLLKRVAVRDPRYHEVVFDNLQVKHSSTFFIKISKEQPRDQVLAHLNKCITKIFACEAYDTAPFASTIAINPVI